MILLLLAYAVGGAIINVAVAWGCAVYPRRHAFSYQPGGLYVHYTKRGSVTTWCEHGRMTLHQFGPGVNAESLYFPQEIDSETYQRLVPSWSAFSQGNPTLSQGDGTRVFSYGESAAGWPFLAFFSSSKTTCFDIDQPYKTTTYGQLELPHSLTERGFLETVPIGPIWPGFAINTIFYAAILWLLFAAPGFVRRRIRARRGQCPTCAYPVGASDICTECGRPVAPSVRWLRI